MPHDTANSPLTRRLSAMWIAGILIIVGIHVVGRIGAYCSPLKDDDSYIFASFGYRMVHGDVLYRDISDIKPPGLYMLYAANYFFQPAARASIVGVESLFLLLGYYLIYRFNVEWFGRAAGVFAAIAAALSINYFTVTGTAIVGFGVAENFMVFPASGAALFYLRALRRGYHASLIAVGVFLGVDTCIKQTALPLVVALLLHWTFVQLVSRGRVRDWISGLGCMFVGGMLAWLPALVMLIVQGTTATAVDLLTSDAGAMFGRASAWPTRWRDVLPLWLPLVCLCWACIARIEARSATTRETSVPGITASALSFLALWCGLELYLLINLPLRSTHYYVACSVPLFLACGWPVAEFGRRVARWRTSVRFSAWAAAVVLSLVFCRHCLDEIVPRSITAYAHYDWVAEKERFYTEIHRGPIHYGRGAPFAGAIDGSD